MFSSPPRSASAHAGSRMDKFNLEIVMDELNMLDDDDMYEEFMPGNIQPLT